MEVVVDDDVEDVVVEVALSQLKFATANNVFPKAPQVAFKT